MEGNDEYTEDGRDAPSRLTDPRPPNVIERGIVSWGLCVAILIAGILPTHLLQAWLMTIFEIRHETFVGHEDGRIAAWLLVGMVLVFARPTHPRHWVVMAIVATVSLAVGMLIWALAASILFSVVPQANFGFVGAILLGLSAGGGSWVAFRIFHRLAGSSSPWWDEDKVSDTGISP